MATKSKPTILLIPGSFGLPEFYDPVMTLVREKGYTITGLHKPSVGLSARENRGPGVPPPSMDDDAAYIAGEAEKLINEGKDVILMPHSYGGVPASQCTKGLGKEERKAQGKQGGIVNIAYMTCLVPAIGQSAKDVLANVPPEQQVQLNPKEDGWMIHDPVEPSAKLCFSDLPLEEGVAWMMKFPQHSALSFVGELTHAGYKDIPTSWLFCEGDLVIPPQVQQATIDMIEKESGGRKVEVTRIPRDHIPNAKYPEEVADWIVSVAERY